MLVKGGETSPSFLTIQRSHIEALSVMTRNLETADTIVKLILAISTILLYALGLIAGPFALALFVMSLLMVILLFHPNYL